jgi:hypothetical protein
MELSGGSRLMTFFDNPGTYGPLYVTIQGNIFEGSGSSLIHFRRNGGSLRVFNNIYADGTLRINVDGAAQPEIEIMQDYYLELADATVSGNIAEFLGGGASGDFGGVIVHVKDVTDFDLTHFGSGAYSQVNTSVAVSSYATNGADILFRNYQPSTLSAGDVQIGTNAAGIFKMRNDGGSTKRFKVTFER